MPTPNLFTGVKNVHEPQEWVSAQDLSRAVTVCIELARLWTKQ